MDVADVLLVEDEPRLAELVARELEAAGYAVRHARDGAGALRLFAEAPPDLVLLDWMLPGMDGLEVLRRLRQGSAVPVLMLTARAEEVDRVVGLEVGADDYLTKPFAVSELFARVRALVRRGPAARPPHLSVGDVVLDPSTHKATRAGRDLDLTPKAFALLEYLMHRPGEVVSRAELLEHVWDFAYDGSSNVVDAYVSRVRDAVDRPFEDAVIETVRGVGYRLRATARR